VAENFDQYIDLKVT